MNTDPSKVAQTRPEAIEIRQVENGYQVFGQGVGWPHVFQTYAGLEQFLSNHFNHRASSVPTDESATT